MRLEDQLTSLELSKRLAELGIKQDSIFYWITSIHHKDEIITRNKLLNEKAYPVKQYSAFTASELLEILPACVDTKKDEPFNNFWLHINKRSAKNIQYIASYICDTHAGDEIIDGDNLLFRSLCRNYDEILSNCLAKILIFLIENGICEA